MPEVLANPVIASPASNGHVFPVSGHSKPTQVYQQMLDVNSAAQTYGVNPGILWGIFGAESSYGKASSWFGLTSAYPGKGTSGDWATDVDLAAKTLADNLNAAGGDYEKALRYYSAGPEKYAQDPTAGYGLDHIRDVLKSAPKGGGIDAGKLVDSIPGVKEVKQAANTVEETATDVAGAIAKFYSLITSLEFWLRLGEGIAGLVLIAMGLKALTGVTIPTPVGRV